jgi:hypothetical protein
MFPDFRTHKHTSHMPSFLRIFEVFFLRLSLDQQYLGLRIASITSSTFSFNTKAT